MSPMYMKALAHAAQLGQLDIRCGEPRVVARPSGTAADVCGETGSLSVVIEPDPLRKVAGEEKHEQPSEMDGPGRGAADFDKVLLGTGNTTNCRALPLLRDLLDNVETVPIVGGLPVLSTDLQWGCLPVFVVGELAGLQLGPGGSNLAGARQGADIVATKLGVNEDADQGKIGGVFTNVFAALAMESDSAGSDTSDSESEGSEDREDQHMDRHDAQVLPVKEPQRHQGAASPPRSRRKKNRKKSGSSGRGGGRRRQRRS